MRGENINMEQNTNSENTYKLKPRAIRIGFSEHDCESWYRCPICKQTFGSYQIFHQQTYCCPNCKTELDGLE